MAVIHIADNKTDEIVDFIPESDYWNDERIRELETNRDTFDFETFATESYSGAIENRNRVIIPNRHERGYSEFIIEEAAQVMEETGLHFKAAYTTASYLELRKQKQIPPQTLNGRTPAQNMELALVGTEWQVGDVDYGEVYTAVLESYTDAYSFLLDISAQSGMELVFRVEHNGYRITGRYVDLLDRAGEWRGHEAVFSEDLLSIERRRKYDAVVTALIGIGPEGENGAAPMEVYVESDTALQRWGRNGQHLVEVYEPSNLPEGITEQDFRILVEEELTRRITHQSEYSATIATLAESMGVDPEDLQFGDVIRIKDEEFNPPIYLEARIHTMKESIKQYGDSEVTLGDFTEFSEDEVKSMLNRLRKQIANAVSSAELAEAIESVNSATRVTQPTPPDDLNALWIDNRKRPYITKVYVDAVNGWVPIMPSTAEEIGADPAGSADAALAFAREDIQEINTSLEGLRNEYDNFVSDGFISKAEALSIERHIVSLNSEKSDVDSDYTATYGNARLTNKAPLEAAKTAYNEAHANLIASINTAIADSVVTATEKADVDAKFASYATALGNYATARANAAQEINSNEAEKQIEDLEIGGTNLIIDNLLERGKYLDVDGTLKDDAPSFVTAPIVINGFTNVTVNTNGKSRWKEIAFFDAAGVFMPPLFSDNDPAIFKLTVPVPTGAATLRFSSSDYEYGFFKVERGSKATAWSPSPEDIDYNAQEKARQAQAAAEEYAAAEAEYARIEAIAYADGLVTDEEQARIQEAADRLAEAKAYAEEAAQNAVDAIDNSDLATKEELAEQADSIRDQLATRGGANLLRNSIGYAGMDFWQFTTSNTSVTSVMNEALTTLGFGSGFYFPPDGIGKGIVQTINVVAGEEYTLSWYLQKMAEGSFSIEIIENSAIIASAADITTVGTGYAGSFLSFTPETTSVSIRFTAAGTAEVTLTGLMVGIGNLPTQWTLASGELYNAYVRADERGLTVLRLDADGNVEGHTSMTPNEFAIYYDTNRDGSPDRVFWMNRDETVTKKLRAIDEITMGTIKIVRIESAANRGWAFVPIIPEDL